MSDMVLLGSKDGNVYGDLNDIKIVDHDVALLTGKDKLIQDIVKMMSTIRGTHFLFTDYGTNLIKIMKKRKTPGIVSDLKQEIIYVIQWVQQMNINEDINISKIIDVKLTDGANYINIELQLLCTDGTALTLNYKK